MTSLETLFSYNQIKEAADYIQSKTDHKPSVGLILGSGLGPLAEEIQEADIIPYTDIPNFPHSTVRSHVGRLVIGKLAGKTALVMQGRTHFYEGASMQRITLPVRAMQLLGIDTLIITNAAGGINRDFQKGDLMLIKDHINLLGMGGYSPLRGPNLDQFGPRFPGMTHTYDRKLISLAHEAANDLSLTLQEGVYAQWAGPTFETPAEIRFLSAIGADAVGMSTIPEAIVANHGGMRILAISSITNMAIHEPHSGLETSTEEVWETVKLIVPKLAALLKTILAEID